MKIVSVKQMKAIDKISIEQFGIAGVVLMEKAGMEVVSMIKDYIKELTNIPALVICGKGNNGGDGFVVSRLLFQEGADVVVLILGKEKEIKGDALVNFKIIKKLGIQYTEIDKINNNKLKNLFNSAEIIVDAIFGTGFRGEPKGVYKKIIEMINSIDKLVFSIDIPSGVDADTGQVLGEGVFADATCTMGMIKKGMLLYPARYYTGKLYIGNIGIPMDNILDELNIETELIDDDFVAKILPLRFPYSHKGNYGKVFVIAGSKGMTGASVLSSEAALRAGAGLVYVGVPDSLMDIFEAKLTEVIKVPLKGGNGVLELEALGDIYEFAKDKDVVLIGPGLSRCEELKKLEKKLFPKFKKRHLVIDADGINNMNISLLEYSQGNWVLTPHPGEFSKLSGFSIDEIESNRIEIARKFAIEHRVILVLKGVPTVVASPDGTAYINSTGNSGLASGGSGDILSGLIAGFISQGATPLEASISGVYIHGLSADIAVEETTEYSLIAGDLLNYIGKAIKKIMGAS